MSTQTATVNKTEKRVNVRYLTVTAMLSAVAYILMFLDFSVPFMPAFIKMDLSDNHQWLCGRFLLQSLHTKLSSYVLRS